MEPLSSSSRKEKKSSRKIVQYPSNIPSMKDVIELSPQKKKFQKCTQSIQDFRDIFFEKLFTIPFSSSEHQKFSLLAALSVLTEDQLNLIPYKDKLIKAKKEIQSDLFQMILVSEGFLVHLPIEEIEKEIIFHSFKIGSDLQLCFCGKSGSGKSMFLSIFAQTTFYRLIFSNEPYKYLPFVLNCAIHEMDFTEQRSLFRLIVHLLFQAIHSIRLEIWPVLISIREWLLNILFIGSIISLPEDISSFPFINSELLIETASRFLKCLGKETFWNSIFNLPDMISRAFGFQDVLFIIDHIDLLPASLQHCLVLNHFLISFKNDSLCKSLSKSSSQSTFEQLPLLQTNIQGTTTFIPKNAVFIHIKSLVSFLDDRQLVLPKLNLTLDSTDCFGCPGFLVNFSHVLDESEQFLSSTSLSFQNTESATTSFRKQFVQVKIQKLIKSLFELENEKITNSIIESIYQIQNLDFRVKRKK